MPSRASFALAMTALVAVLVAAPLARAPVARAAGAPDGLPAVLPREADVRDPVLSLLVGLIDSDVYGTLSRERLQEWLDGQPRRSRLPHERIREITRRRPQGAAPGTVSIVFDAPVAAPLPYSVLGYHPGDVVASESCMLREWSLGTMLVTRGDGDELVLEDVRLYGVEQGRIAVDVDAWLDVLLGGTLDDTSAAFLMLCRVEDRWLGFAMGDSDDGEPRSGILDLGRDRVLIPVPARLRGVAWIMRKYAESIPTARSWTPSGPMLPASR